MKIRESLLEKSKVYLSSIPETQNASPPELLVDFVIEKYAQQRNFPSAFSEEKIEKDMEQHLSTMAMAVVDIFLKTGAQNQISHSENGISRTYENAYISLSIFNDVLPFVKVL